MKKNRLSTFLNFLKKNKIVTFLFFLISLIFNKLSEDHPFLDKYVKPAFEKIVEKTLNFDRDELPQEIKKSLKDSIRKDFILLYDNCYFYFLYPEKIRKSIKDLALKYDFTKEYLKHFKKEVYKKEELKDLTKKIQLIKQDLNKAQKREDQMAQNEVFNYPSLIIFKVINSRKFFFAQKDLLNFPKFGENIRLIKKFLIEPTSLNKEILNKKFDKLEATNFQEIFNSDFTTNKSKNKSSKEEEYEKLRNLLDLQPKASEEEIKENLKNKFIKKDLSTNSLEEQKKLEEKISDFSSFFIKNKIDLENSLEKLKVIQELKGLFISTLNLIRLYAITCSKSFYMEKNNFFDLQDCLGNKSQIIKLINPYIDLYNELIRNVKSAEESKMKDFFDKYPTYESILEIRRDYMNKICERLIKKISKLAVSDS